MTTNANDNQISIKKPARARVKAINVFDDGTAPVKRTYTKKVKATNASNEVSDALVLSVSAPVTYSDSRAVVLSAPGSNEEQMATQVNAAIDWAKAKFTQLQASFFKNKEMIILASGLTLVALLSVFYMAAPNKSSAPQEVEISKSSVTSQFDEKALVAANQALLKAPNKAVPAATLAKVDKAPVLKLEKTLTVSVLFLDGATTLGPAGRAKAMEIKNKMAAGDKVDLYGYAGVNAANDTKFQYTIAQSRAMSVKMQLVELGADPKSVSVMDPNGYLFKEALPQDPKQVKSVIRSTHD